VCVSACYRVLPLSGFPSIVKIIYRVTSEAIGMVIYIGFIHFLEEANFTNKKRQTRINEET
jgi:hypothetical protein